MAAPAMIALRLAVFPAAALLSATVAIAEPGTLTDHAPAPSYAQSPEVAVVRQWTEFAATADPFGLIVVMGYVIRVLWREDKDKDGVHAKELAERDAEIRRLHERRAEEGVENARRITEVATQAAATVADNVRAMVEWGGSIRAVREQSEVNGRTLADLVTRIGQNYDAIQRLSGRGHA